MANAIAPKGSNSSLKGALIPNYSTVAYGLVSDADFGFNPNYSESYGSTNWRNSIGIGATANGSENNPIYYAIYSDLASQGSAGTNLAIAWGITDNTGINTAILNTVNRLPEMDNVTPHANFDDAMSWLISNGYFVANRNYPRIEFSETDLKYAFDPTFMASYPWTSDQVYDLMGNCSTDNGVLIGDAASTVNTEDGSNPYFRVDKTPSNEGFILLPSLILNGTSDVYGITFSLWFKVDSISTEQSLLYFYDVNLPGPWIRFYISDGKLAFEGDLRNTGSTSTPANFAAGFSPGEYYLATVSIDLTNDVLNVWVSNTSTFELYKYNASYTYGGTTGQPSSNSTDGAVAMGARVTSAYPSSTYNGQGVDGNFGSLFIHVDSSEYSFTSNMAQKIWNETKAYY